MKTDLLTMLSALTLICGCAGRMDSDLLQARIREQAAQLSESQQELERTRAQLKQSRMEAAQMKSELDHTGDQTSADPTLSVVKVRIHPLSSGGLNKDNHPGDDVVVVQFVPLDAESRPVKAAGELEFQLVDPLLPEHDRELGAWKFSTSECQSHWTRGITSSGFQFTLPLTEPTLHANVVLRLKYRTTDARELEASQIVKVAVAPLSGSPPGGRRRLPNQNAPLIEEESDESLPLIEKGENSSDTEDGSRTHATDSSSQTLPGRAVLHSSNWTDATIPTLR